MNIEFSVGSRSDARRIDGDRAPQLFIVGNFSGDTKPRQQAVEEPAIRNMLSVDIADIDGSLAKLGPRLALDVDGELMELGFGGLDDFHPDRLYRVHPAFNTVNELKQALADPSRTEAAAALCRHLLGLSPADEAPGAPAANEAATGGAESTEDALTRLLGQPSGGASRGNAAARAAVDRILEQAVADSKIAPRATADVAALGKQLNAWCSSAMRELLRLRGFRQLEANWRSLQWLAERVDCEPEPSLWLVDVESVTAAAWVDEIGSRIVQVADDADMLVVLHDFSAADDSLELLQRIAETASTSGMTVFAGASADLAGQAASSNRALALDASDFDDAGPESWNALRHRPVASAVGIGYPRILLRQPYGSRSDAVDAFDFEELESAPDHESFLWGCPGIVLATMSVNSSNAAGDVPVVVYDDGSGQAIKPPTEVYLTDSAGEKLLGKGIMALMGKRGATDLRIIRMQSIADPPGAL
jgi:type VI secretion system protein ImpC